jgi:hypothetical protein
MPTVPNVDIEKEAAKADAEAGPAAPAPPNLWTLLHFQMVDCRHGFAF